MVKTDRHLTRKPTRACLNVQIQLRLKSMTHKSMSETPSSNLGESVGEGGVAVGLRPSADLSPNMAVTDTGRVGLSSPHTNTIEYVCPREAYFLAGHRE